MGKSKGKKKKQLTGLAAALVKSGHISDKDARKLTRDQRREDKALGQEGVPQGGVERHGGHTHERRLYGANRVFIPGSPHETV